MKNALYIDCGLTDLLAPELLSLGMVSSLGDEFYAELALEGDERGPTPTGPKTLLSPSLASTWGRIRGCATDRCRMGARTAAWVLKQSARFGQPACIAFRDARDYQLFQILLRDTGNWEEVRSQVCSVDVSELTVRFDAMLGADAAYVWALRRGLERNHPLADAHALRGACVATLTGKQVKLGL